MADSHVNAAAIRSNSQKEQKRFVLCTKSPDFGKGIVIRVINKIIVYIVLGIMLGVCGLQDLKEKMISLWIVGAALLIILLLFLLKGNVTWDNAFGALVGLILIGLSKITKGQIGIGDGFIFFVTGLGLGLWNNFTLLGYSLVFAVLFLAILRIGKRGRNLKTIPFIPFVFIGYLGVLIV